jgi:hypothetical protein
MSDSISVGTISAETVEQLLAAEGHSVSLEHAAALAHRVRSLRAQNRALESYLAHDLPPAGVFDPRSLGK